MFKPFSKLTQSQNQLILGGWVFILLLLWGSHSLFNTTHMFPSINQVFTGFGDLWRDGLVVHILSSLTLCFSAIAISLIISLLIVYSSPISELKPLSIIISKLRYLPLTGITFYITMFVTDARMIQIWVLVAFMTSFLITSLLAMIKDIPDDEFEHARTQGCTKWETLYEVIIVGRLDYVIECLRQNLAIVWMSIVTVESILISAGGLGFLIKNGDRIGSNGRVIAVQIIIIIIGVVLDWLLTQIRKLSFPYSKF
jgi:ABC-type nitrate/sulfonate/bicarbonate transport system permease component